MDPRLYLRARAIRPPPLRFIAVSTVMGRRGKVRYFRNPRASLSLFLSSLLYLSEGRSSYLPDYIASRYVSAREIVFERPIVWHTPALPEVTEKEKNSRECSFFFFFFQPRIFLRVNRCGNAAAENVREHQPTQDDRNCSADKSMTFLPNDVEDSKRK